MVSGCTTVTSSEVEQVANGRYKVSANMKGVKVNRQDNSKLTNSRVIYEAKEFCRKKGYRYAQINDKTVERSGRATAVIYFNCTK